MGKKLVMLPAKDVDLSTVDYHCESIKAPKLTGFTLKLFVWLIELPIIGPWLLSSLKERNKFTQMLQNTVIPETPMFRPEFPPQEPEPGVILMDEDGAPVVRAESALECLPPCDPNRHSGNGSPGSFLYWTIRDYAHAYRFRRVTPSMVAEHVISYVEESKNKKVPNRLLISFIAEDVRKQAMASTRRFEEGTGPVYCEILPVWTLLVSLGGLDYTKFYIGNIQLLTWAYMGGMALTPHDMF